MREFWEQRAAENPLFYVDNKLDYRHPDAQTFWQRGEQELDEMLSAVDAEVRPEEDVVEVGCGVGRLTRVLARRGRSVRALDISPRMLELATENCAELDNVDFVLGDGSSLTGIHDASADACVSLVVFQHIPDPAVTLDYIRDIGRVLRPGGWAVFQISNDPHLHSRRGGLERMSIILRGLTGRGPRGQENPAWLGSHVELDDLRAAARDGGMDVERISGEGRQFCFVRTRRT